MDLNAKINIDTGEAENALTKLLRYIKSIDIAIKQVIDNASKIRISAPKTSKDGSSESAQKAKVTKISVDNTALKEYRTASAAARQASLSFGRQLTQLEAAWVKEGHSIDAVNTKREEYVRESGKATQATRLLDQALKARVQQAKVDLGAGKFDKNAYLKDVLQLQSQRKLLEGRKTGTTLPRQINTNLTGVLQQVTALDPSLNAIFGRVVQLQEVLAPLEGDLLMAGSGFGAMGAGASALIPGLLGLVAAAAGIGGSIALVNSSINAGIAAFAPFEQALKQLEVLGGLDERQVASLKTEIQDLSKTFPQFDTTSITNYTTELVKSGRSASEAVEMVRLGMQASIATGDDLGNILSDTNSAVMAMGLSFDRVPEIMAVSASAANATKASFEDIVRGMADTGGMANVLGEDMSALAAIVGKGKDLNIDAAEVARSYNATLARLARQPKQAAAALKQFGISVADSNGRVKPFITLLGEMREKLGAKFDLTSLKGFAQIVGADHIRNVGLLVANYDQLVDTYRKVALAQKSVQAGTLAPTATKAEVTTFVSDTRDLLAAKDATKQKAELEKQLQDTIETYKQEGRANDKAALDDVYNRKKDIANLDKKIAIDNALAKTADDLNKGLITAEEATKRIGALQKDLAVISGANLEDMAKAMKENFVAAEKSLKNIKDLGQQQVGEQTIKTKTQDVNTQIQTEQTLIDEGVFERQGQALDAIQQKWVGVKASVIEFSEKAKLALFEFIAGTNPAINAVVGLTGAVLTLVGVFTGNIPLMVAGVGALGVSFAPLINEYLPTLIQWFNNVGTAVFDFVAAAGEYIKAFAANFAAVYAYLQAWGSAVQANFGRVGQFLGAWFVWLVQTAVEQISTFAQNWQIGWASLPKVVGSVLRSIGQYLSDWGSQAANIVKTVFYNITHLDAQKDLPKFVVPQIQFDSSSLPKFKSAKPIPVPAQLELVPLPQPPKITTIAEIKQTVTTKKAERTAKAAASKAAGKDDDGNGAGTGAGGRGAGGGGRGAGRGRGSADAKKRKDFTLDENKIAEAGNRVLQARIELQKQLTAEQQKQNQVVQELTERNRQIDLTDKEKLKDKKQATDFALDELSLQEDAINNAAQFGDISESQKIAAIEALDAKRTQLEYEQDLADIADQQLDLEKQKNEAAISAARFAAETAERKEKEAEASNEILAVEAQLAEVANQRDAAAAKNLLNADEEKKIAEKIKDLEEQRNKKIEERDSLIKANLESQSKDAQAGQKDQDAIDLKDAEIKRKIKEAEQKKNLSEAKSASKADSERRAVAEKQAEAVTDFAKDGIEFGKGVREQVAEAFADGKITLEEAFDILKSVFDGAAGLFDKVGELGKIGGGGGFSGLFGKAGGAGSSLFGAGGLTAAGGLQSKLEGFVAANAQGVTKGFASRDQAEEYGQVLGSLVTVTDGAQKSLKLMDTQCGLAATAAGKMGEGAELAGTSLGSIFSGSTQITKEQVSAGAISDQAKSAGGGGSNFSFGKIFSVGSSILGLVGSFFQARKQKEEQRIEKELSKFKKRMDSATKKVDEADNDLYATGLVSLSNRVSARVAAIGEATAAFNKLSKAAKKQAKEDFKAEISKLNREIKELSIEKGKLAFDYSFKAELAGIQDKSARDLMSNIREAFLEASRSLEGGFDPGQVRTVFNDQLSQIREDAFKPLDEELAQATKDRTDLIKEIADREQDNLKSLLDDLSSILKDSGFTKELSAEEEIKQKLKEAAKTREDLAKSDAQRIDDLNKQEQDILKRRSALQAAWAQGVGSSGALVGQIQAAGGEQKFFEGLGSQIAAVKPSQSTVQGLISAIVASQDAALNEVATQLKSAQ